MSEINDGGPAFPFKCQGPTTAPEVYYGMALRDYLAAHESLAELDQSDRTGLPVEIAEQLAGRKRPAKIGMDFLQWEADWRAAWKYIRADAMLAARSKPKV